MKPSKQGVFIFILFIICIGIHLFSRDALRAEIGYSGGFFVSFSHFLRSITGRWQFSLGDLLYPVLILFFLYGLFQFFRSLAAKDAVDRKGLLKKTGYSFSVLIMLLYIIFNLFWGINYNRKGIAWQLQLKMGKPDSRQLSLLNEELLQKLNHSRSRISELDLRPMDHAELFAGTVAAYENLNKEFSFLAYTSPSIKSSLWGKLGNYAGFTGYYNPFTGEAQVNTTVPAFMQPFVACHEVAHQLGYAKEMEANFVGYLAASRSTDPRFLYSVYLDLFLFANRDLSRKDTALASGFRRRMIPEVQADLEEWKAFDKKHESFLDPLISKIYDRFLKSNNDRDGMNSYARVTALLVAYREKSGKL